MGYKTFKIHKSGKTKMQVAGQEAVSYSYDVNSRLIGINTLINSVAQGFSLAYDANGRRTSLSLPNGITTNYSYDNASRLLNLEHLNPLNSILEKISYAYDSNGNRTSMNRLNVTPSLPNPANNITYNTANQLTSFNGQTLAYDTNGNLISKGDVAYQWNARNQLIGITSPTINASFKYDALGRRIEKTINGKSTQYLYDGFDIVQEIENGIVSANYLRTLNIDEPLTRIKSDGTVRYYQTDALGSVIALTDENGAIRTQYNYDPFGNTTITGETSDNPFQYAGRENDGMGLLFERNRYYSFELQRYISEDPIGLAGGDVNFYVRVGNNPVNFIDPLGLWYIDIGYTGSATGRLGPGGTVGFQIGPSGIFFYYGFGIGFGAGAAATFNLGDPCEEVGVGLNFAGGYPVFGIPVGAQGSVGIGQQSGISQNFGVGLGLGFGVSLGAIQTIPLFGW